MFVIPDVRARVPRRHLGRRGAALPPARPLLHDVLLRVSGVDLNLKDSNSVTPVHGSWRKNIFIVANSKPPATMKEGTVQTISTFVILGNK